MNNIVTKMKKISSYSSKPPLLPPFAPPPYPNQYKLYLRKGDRELGEKS